MGWRSSIDQGEAGRTDTVRARRQDPATTQAEIAALSAAGCGDRFRRAVGRGAGVRAADHRAPIGAVLDSCRACRHRALGSAGDSRRCRRGREPFAGRSPGAGAGRNRSGDVIGTARGTFRPAVARSSSAWRSIAALLQARFSFALDRRGDTDRSPFCSYPPRPLLGMRSPIAMADLRQCWLCRTDVLPLDWRASTRPWTAAG